MTQSLRKPNLNQPEFVNELREALKKENVTPNTIGNADDGTSLLFSQDSDRNIEM